MDFFETIELRRSVRRFTDKIVPEEIVTKALDAAVLAPNSSNAQTWDFYWVKNPEKKLKLIQYCLNQSTARTASHLIVITANPKAWKRSWEPLKRFTDIMEAPRKVKLYYEKIFPYIYKTGFLNIIGLIKKMSFFIIGNFRPIMRGPTTLRDVQEVCIKSAALAAENFVLAITAQGYGTCMMEGFDEARVKGLLKLKSYERVVMVISVGEIAPEKAIWGPRFRINIKQVVHEV
jgi:nitroreductase